MGFHPLAHDGYPGLGENLVTSQGLFRNGITGVLITTLAVLYAFSGSELIGVAAGETASPAVNIPKAMRTTVIRLLIFFVGAIAVIASTAPYGDASLQESPFVTVFSQLGIPYAADVMNFVIITALLSAGNCGLFSCTRVLFSLADEGHAPKALGKLTKRGIPILALCVSMLGSLASLIPAWLLPPRSIWCSSPSRVSPRWASGCPSRQHIFHRRNFIRAGGNTASPFVGACYPYFHYKYGRGQKGRPNDQNARAQTVDAP